MHDLQRNIQRSTEVLAEVLEFIGCGLEMMVYVQGLEASQRRLQGVGQVQKDHGIDATAQSHRYPATLRPCPQLLQQRVGPE